MIGRRLRWIEAILVNDEASTDSELIQGFMKEGRLSRKEAIFYVKQRGKALSDPIHFKLVKYRREK